MHNPKIHRHDQGFSLIELIIAIAILVILTGLLTPQLLRYIEHSREVRDLSAIDVARQAMILKKIEDPDFKEISGAVGGSISYGTGWYAFEFNSRELHPYTSSLDGGADANFKGLTGTAADGGTDLESSGVKIWPGRENITSTSQDVSSYYFLIGMKGDDIYIAYDSQGAEGPSNTGSASATPGNKGPKNSGGPSAPTGRPKPSVTPPTKKP